MKWDAIKLVWHPLKGVFTAFEKRNYVLNWEIYDVYRFCSSQLMHDVIGNLFIFFSFFNRKLLLISHINYIFFLRTALVRGAVFLRFSILSNTDTLA